MTLTIEPGVEMRFKKGGVFRIAVFTSTSPAARLAHRGRHPRQAHRLHVQRADAGARRLARAALRRYPDPQNKVDYVRIVNAGGASTSGSGSCPDNSELDERRRDPHQRLADDASSSRTPRSSAAPTNGIDRGWRDDREKIDFLSTIKFTGVALCNQTYPPNAANVCPDPVVPCPTTP